MKVSGDPTQKYLIPSEQTLGMKALFTQPRVFQVSPFACEIMLRPFPIISNIEKKGISLTIYMSDFLVHSGQFWLIPGRTYSFWYFHCFSTTQARELQTK